MTIYVLVVFADPNAVYPQQQNVPAQPVYAQPHLPNSLSQNTPLNSRYCECFGIFAVVLLEFR